MPKIMYLLDMQTGEKHKIPEKQHINLGRSSAEIPISKDERYKPESEIVSRAHCRLIRQDLSDVVIEDPADTKIGDFPSGLGVVDLESKNGTYVGVEKISKKPFPLNNGDVLILGKYGFRVMIGELPITEPISSSPTTTLQ